mgnify:CR=1 FL=1
MDVVADVADHIAAALDHALGHTGAAAGEQNRRDLVTASLGHERLVTATRLDLLQGPAAPEPPAADRDPVTGRPVVDIAHEALLAEWPRLAGWLDDALLVELKSGRPKNPKNPDPHESVLRIYTAADGAPDGSGRDNSA